jgi:excisionase family DNA binding protein
MAKKKSYTVTEAAKYLRVSRAAVLLAIKRKRLPAEWGTKTVDVLLIPAKDVRAYRVNAQKRRAGKKN